VAQGGLSPSLPGPCPLVCSHLPRQGILPRVGVRDLLPRHDVHIPGEEHAADAALCHRLDKGILDLGEGSAVRNRIRILDDLGGLADEEGVEAGVGIGVAHNRAILVALLRSLLTLRTVPFNTASRSLQLPALLVGQAEVDELIAVEIVSRDIHPNDTSVQLGTHRLHHSGDGDVGNALAEVVLHVEAVRRSVNLVDHGDGATVLEVVEGVCHLVILNRHTVGLTIGDEHEGGNLNVLLLHPILHELRGDSHGLNGGRTVKVEATGVHDAALVHDQRLIDVGKQTLTLTRAVPRGGEVDEAGILVANRSGLGILRGEVVQKLNNSIVLHALLLQLLEHLFVLVMAVDGTGIDIGEGEHLKRNLHLLAEPHQLNHLQQRIGEAVTHATGKVKQEHDAVILAVLLDDLADEDVIMGAVLMEAVKVQHPGLLGTLPADLVRSLAAVELRGQLTNEGIGVLDELAVVIKVERTALVGLLKLRKQELGGQDGLVHLLDRGDGQGWVAILLPVLLAAVGELRKVRSTVTLMHLAIVGLLTLLLLHLLPNALHGGMIVQTLGDLVHLLKGDHGIHLVHDLLLLAAERNIKESRHTPLEVKVEAVDDGGVGNVHLGEGEHIPIHDLLVAQEEVAASAGVLVLHQLLNADILHDIGDALKEGLVVALLLRSIKDGLALLVGSPQGVADLMRDEHGLHRFGDIPNGHDEVTLLHIEGSGFSRGVEGERKVLGSESAGEDGERTDHARTVPDDRGKVKR